MASSGWFADPLGRHEKRYFNGLVWTDRVLDGALHASDPIGGVNQQSPSTGSPAPTVAPQHIVVAPRTIGNGYAVAALTLGLIGAVLALNNPFGSVLAILCGLLGLIFGLVGLRRVANYDAGLIGLAIAGVVLGSFAVIVAGYQTWNFYRFTHAVEHAFSAQTSGPVIDANPTTDHVRITRCYRLPTGSPAATGTLVNNSRERHSFKLTIAFHLGQPGLDNQSVLGIGITGPIDPGETATWSASDDSASFPPTSCTIAPPPNPIP